MKVNDFAVTMEGLGGVTLLQIVAGTFDPSKIATALVVLVTTIIQLYTLVKKKKTDVK